MLGRFRCQGCGKTRRRGGDYLCVHCWPQLPLVTRNALFQRDGQALRRYRELLEKLKTEPLAAAVIQ